MSKLAVILPVYSGDNLDFFKKSVSSILNQTYTEFILFIIKDGRLKKEHEVFLSSIRDTRLNLIGIKKNKGLPNALNIGIKKALHSGVEYIARMDADDIAKPNRLLNQIKFLEENREVKILGCEAVLIDENANQIGNKKVKEEVTFKTLLKNCELIHPSVVFRADVFEKIGFYDVSLSKSQDYDLWLRAAKEKIVIRNLKEPLMQFRYERQLIKRRKDEQKFNILIKRKHLKGLSFYTSIIKHLLIMYIPTFLLKKILEFKIRK
ncbi:glycosyltransferase [Tenacibaculum ovolyticum]|uniref:glycosyltransferase n=1 Tax=Tenacibaculum ovolyticum TaxID=104270 RepID=UPI00042132DD|nr:glycosyltransferase [Tenacibaculum ovolyticum]